MSADKRYFEGSEHAKLYVSSRPTLPKEIIVAIKEYLLKKRYFMLCILTNTHLKENESSAFKLLNNLGSK